VRHRALGSCRSHIRKGLIAQRIEAEIAARTGRGDPTIGGEEDTTRLGARRANGVAGTPPRSRPLQICVRRQLVVASAQIGGEYANLKIDADAEPR
jgi:hypothetical protein